MATSESESNLQRFEEAGMIKTPLPAKYLQVINDLTSGDVDLLIDMKQRLDAAQADTTADISPYASYILGPVF
jgi:hypothetical protein